MSETHAPARILVVEDHQQGAELLEAFLAGSGYEVRTALGGEASLGVVREWKPDLVLLDVMMPRLSGFEVCKQIKADPKTHNVAVIMVTALDQPSDIDRAVEVGTNDFITKPINKAELLLRIRAMLAHRRGQELPDTIDYINAVQSGR